MNFECLLLSAKAGNEDAITTILQMYRNAPNTESIGILYPVRCRLFNLSDSNVHTHYNLDAW